MNVTEHIKQLRSCAETNRAEAAELHAEAAKLRGEAEKHQAKADGATAKAHECEEMAAGWDHVADLLESGVAGPAEDIDAPIPFVLAEDAQTAPAAAGAAAPDLIGEMARYTSTHGTTAANADEFAVGDLVNVSQPKHPHWGQRGKVVGFTDDVPALVAVEYDNLGNCLYLAPSQLMHHTEFVKRDQEYFDAAEAADVRRIEHDAAIDAGDDHDPDTCPECER